MPMRTVLFLFVLTTAVLLGALAATVAAVLAHLAGAHPATALARGGVAFAATLTVMTALTGLAYTVF